MEAFTTLSGAAAPLPQANVDTDVIMPKQFLKGITREGLAAGLFYDLRFDAEGRELDFVLNHPAYREARFLVVGPNFGCGSSREHAVWGLRQFGIRCLLGTSFASIFQDNCFRNGLLPLCLQPDEIEWLQSVCADPLCNTLALDLRDQTLSWDGGGTLRFTVDAMRRDDLLNGRDAVASTLQYADEIHAFERRHWSTRPWLKPPGISP
jgi:3-isopropylmalate/(R)-2-methylmalate dehydratase small subunit